MNKGSSYTDSAVISTQFYVYFVVFLRLKYKFLFNVYFGK